MQIPNTSTVQPSLSSCQQELSETLKLLNSSIDVICSFDAEGCFLRVGAASETLWGYDPEELIGKKYTELIIEEDLQKSYEARNAIINGSDVTMFENRYKCKDGSILPMLWSAHWDAGQNIMYCVAKDGREKVRIENELMAKERELREAVLQLQEKNRHLQEINDLVLLGDMIPQIIWVADSNGNTYYVNQRWYQYTGLSELDVEGSCTSVVHPEDIAITGQTWSRCSEKGEDFEVEQRLKRASDGEYRWHLARARPLRDSNGKIIKWFGTSTDIHDRKMMQEQVEKSNQELTYFRNIAIEEMQKKSQFLNGVLKNLPVIVFRLDENGITTDSMGAGLQLVGLTEGQAVGVNAYDVYPEMQKRVEKMRSHGVHEYESFNIVNGKEVFFQMYLFPDDLTGNGVLSFGLDVTEKKKAEQILKRAKLQAEAANQFKTRFLASMSHEIRTPLNAILGFARILKNVEISRAESIEYLDYIESSGSLLLKLIGDILDLSKIEEGKLNIQEEEFVFQKAIEELILPYKFKANEKGLEFELFISDEIPFALVGDVYRLNQIIINLIGNALKFTREGKIKVTLDIASGKTIKPGCINLRVGVQDTGIGISREKQSAIFESFVQADDSIVREFGGSGLGLSITSQLINLMGGTIRVESPLNVNGIITQGTGFYVELPLKISDRKSPRSHLPNYDKGTFIFGDKIRVLVAEDNELNQRLASFMLSKIGCHADIAKNGIEVIELLRTNDYDLVFMDVQMPVMDGFTATRKIRSEFNTDIPIIGLTASVFREDINQCLEAGMSDHMGKPYDQKQLYSMIEKWHSKSN